MQPFFITKIKITFFFIKFVIKFQMSKQKIDMISSLKKFVDTHPQRTAQ